MRQHVIAVQFRADDEIPIEEVAMLVHEALRERGYEATVYGGQRTVSNYGEHLARFVYEENWDA